MVKQYDPKGTHSFVFHFPKDPNKNLRTIGAYGEYKEGKSNFQNKENHEVTDSDWNARIKEHGLDKIKQLKGVVRGLDFSAAEKSKYSKELSASIKNGTVKSEDVSHAVANNYLTDEHKDGLVNPEHDTHPAILSSLVSDSSLHKKIIMHPNAGDETLAEVAKKSNDQEVHEKIFNHRNAGDHALAEVAKKSNDQEVHEKIFNHRNAGDNAMSAIYNNSIGDEFNL